jgi:hypothetical protein
MILYIERNENVPKKELICSKEKLMFLKIYYVSNKKLSVSNYLFLYTNKILSLEHFHLNLGTFSTFLLKQLYF